MPGSKKQEKKEGQQPERLMVVSGEYQRAQEFSDQAQLVKDFGREMVSQAVYNAFENKAKYWRQDLLTPHYVFKDDVRLALYLFWFFASSSQTEFPTFDKGSFLISEEPAFQKEKKKTQLGLEGKRAGDPSSRDNPLRLRYDFQGKLIGCSNWMIEGSAVETISPGDDEKEAKVVYTDRRLDPYFIFLMALISQVQDNELIARFNSRQVVLIISAVEQLQQAQHPLYASTVEGLHRRADALRPEVEAIFTEEKKTADNSPDSLLTLFKTPPYMQTIGLDGKQFIESKNSYITGRIRDLEKQSRGEAQNDQEQANTDECRGLIPKVAQFIIEKKLQWNQTYFNLSDILIRGFIDESLRRYQERLISYYDSRPIALPNDVYIFLEKHPDNSLDSEMNGDEIRLIVPVAPYAPGGSEQTLFPDISFTRYICLAGNDSKLNPTKATIDVHDLFFRVLMSTPSSSESQLALQTQFNSEQWYAVAQALAPLMHTAAMGIFDVQTAFKKADLLRPHLEESTAFFQLGPDKQTRLLSAALSSPKICKMLTEERLKRIKEKPTGSHPHRHKVSIILALVLSGLVETGATFIGQWPTIDRLLNISDPLDSPWVRAFNLHSVVGQSILIPAYCFLYIGMVYGIYTLCNESKTDQIAKAMKKAQVPRSFLII